MNPEQNQPEGNNVNKEDGEGKAQTEQYAKQAITYIYGDSKTFASLVEMMKANEAELESGVAQAAVMIIEKLEKDTGELSTHDLAAAGIAVVTSLLDLANKAGILQEVNEKVGIAAWGKALSMWMKKNPGRVKQSELEAMAQQGQVGSAQTETPAMQQPAPEENQPGLLEA